MVLVEVKKQTLTVNDWIKRFESFQQQQGSFKGAPDNGLIVKELMMLMEKTNFINQLPYVALWN